MSAGSSTNRVAKGVAWASSGQWGNQLLSFGIYTGLARLLSPKVFGIVAIAGIYVAFTQLFVQQGFGTAIVQRSELERDHVDSAFWIATATAASLCLASVMLAGILARLFHEPKVAPVVAWLSFSFIFYALSSIPVALLTRELEFRPLAIRSLVATVAGGATGLTMAYFGCGVWSLVGQQLANAMLGCVCLWSAVPWRPSFKISKRHLRDLYRFSISVAGNDILWFFSQKSDQALVGYGFGSAGLGPYSLASRLITFIHDSIIGPVQSVALPTFSRSQSDPFRLELALHKFCELSSFIALPLFAGIFVVSPDLVPLLFGSKWIPAVPILQVLAIYGGLRGFLGFVHPYLLAKDRPGLYLLVNVLFAAMTFAGCLLAVRWSPKAISVSIVISTSLFALIFLLIIRQVMETRIGPLLKCFAFPVSSSLLMLVIVETLREEIFRYLSPLEMLTLSVATGVVVYISTACLVRRDLVKFIWEMAGQSVFSSDLLPQHEDFLDRGVRAPIKSAERW